MVLTLQFWCPVLLSPCSFGFHHRYASGQPQQLLQPLDLHALHGPPVPRAGRALPLLLLQLPKGLPAGRDKQKEQLIQLFPEPAQLQPEELHAAILCVTSFRLDCLPSIRLCDMDSLSLGGLVCMCIRYLSICTAPHLGAVCVGWGVLTGGGEVVSMGADGRVTQPPDCPWISHEFLQALLLPWLHCCPGCWMSCLCSLDL